MVPVDLPVLIDIGSNDAANSFIVTEYDSIQWQAVRTKKGSPSTTTHSNHLLREIKGVVDGIDLNKISTGLEVFDSHPVCIHKIGLDWDETAVIQSAGKRRSVSIQLKCELRVEAVGESIVTSRNFDAQTLRVTERDEEKRFSRTGPLLLDVSGYLRY